jgi:hypothetical protein
MVVVVAVVVEARVFGAMRMDKEKLMKRGLFELYSVFHRKLIYKLCEASPLGAGTELTRI